MAPKSPASVSGEGGDDTAVDPLPSSTDDGSSDNNTAVDPLPSSDNNTAVKPLTGDHDEEDTSSSSSGHPPLRHSARVADPSIKPLATIPMDATIHRRRRSSKPHQEDKQRHLRVWSEDDEIAILRALADFRDNHGGTVPSSLSHMDAFLDSIRGSLRTDEVKKTQLADKVRRLKNKYEAAAAQGGNRHSFPRRHDRTLYDLSCRVWGSEKKRKMSVENDRKSAAGKKTKEGDVKEAEDEDDEVAQSSEDEDRNDDDDDDDGPARVVVKKGLYPFLTDVISRMGSQFLTGRDAVKMALQSVDPSTALALEERCKKLRLMETQSHVRRVGIISEAVKLATEALEKEG